MGGILDKYLGDFIEASKVLAILVAERESYMYVDKLSHAPSNDLALFYLQEALRDLHSLLRSGKFENKRAEDEAKKLNYGRIGRALEQFPKIEDRKELREITSLLASKALVISSAFREEGEESE